MRLKKRAATGMIAASCVLAFTAATLAPASAIVTRGDDGVWFVGKGDVQSLFGWDAKTSDAQFEGVTFTYKKTVTTTVDCITRYRGTVTVHGSITSTDGTQRTTAFDVRKGKTTVTGAWVQLFGAPVNTGSEPECEEGEVDNSSKVTVTKEELFAHTLQAGRKGNTGLIWSEVK
jgi:hypothetical protein